MLIEAARHQLLQSRRAFEALSRHSGDMASFTLHVLDARGTLGDLRAWLEGRLTDTFARANAVLPLQPLDIVVQAGPHVIPEKGHLGSAPRPGVVFLTVDPTSPVLRPNANASLERGFAHELHHAARWDGPGYGSTLGEALVSEGLAGHFAGELFGPAPEPWESLDPAVVREHTAVAEQLWDETDYDHAGWFWGTGTLPRWLGYSMGFQLVGRFLAAHPGSTAASLAEVDAAAFRSQLTVP